MRMHLVGFAAVLCVLVWISSGCLAYAQPGLIDPGHVAGLPSGTAGLATLSAGALGEGALVPKPAIYGGGGAVDLRVEGQLSPTIGVGGEAFGGAGAPLQQSQYQSSAVLGGGRGFARLNFTDSLVLIAGASLAGALDAHGKPDVPLLNGDLTAAWSPVSSPSFEPYLFGGLHAGVEGSAPLLGMHVGAGLRGRVADVAWLHAGLELSTDMTDAPGSGLLALYVPDVVIANVGVAIPF